MKNKSLFLCYAAFSYLFLNSLLILIHVHIIIKVVGFEKKRDWKRAEGGYLKVPGEIKEYELALQFTTFCQSAFGMGSV